jgi:hypothetical protein
MRTTGTVDASGNSAIPQGLFDMAELGNKLEDSELDDRIAALLKAENPPEEVKAKFKLEVIFTESRTIHAPLTGVVMAWTNGGFMHGGGDEVVYFCPKMVDAPNGGTTMCREPLSILFVSKRIAVCPKCKATSDPKELVGQFFAKLPMEKWATLVTKMFGVLGCNADIRIGTMRGDLRRANEREDEKYMRGEHLDRVRNSREWVIYPLRNIIKDTAAGADLYNRMRAFLSA